MFSDKVMEGTCFQLNVRFFNLHCRRLKWFECRIQILTHSVLIFTLMELYFTSYKLVCYPIPT